MRGASDPAQLVEFALVDLGPLRIGVPTEAVVQAIPLPSGMTRLPRSHGELAGVFSYLGRVVPLVSLDRFLGAAAPEASTLRQVLILRAADRLVGVLVESLKGLWKLPCAQVRRIHHDDDAQELFHSVAFGADGQQLISLLDPARLAEQAQVWAQDGPAALHDTQPDGTAQHAAALTPSYAVLRVGTHYLGVAAELVGEVTRCTPLQKMAGLGAEFLGITQWRRRDVPVLDMAQLLELPGTAARSAGWQLVLEQDGRCAAFYVDEICAVRRFDQSALQALGGESSAFARFVSDSVAGDQGERIYLLQVQRVLDASPLSAAPAAPEQAKPDAGLLQLAMERREDDGALVVVQSKQAWALPMHTLREIVPAPPQWLPCADAARHVVGGIEWRGVEVPVVDLGWATRAAPTVLRGNACVLLAEVNQRLAGLWVENLLALIPEHLGTRSQFRAHGRMVRMATVGSAEQQQSYQILDLANLEFFSAA